MLCQKSAAARCVLNQCVKTKRVVLAKPNPYATWMYSETAQTRVVQQIRQRIAGGRTIASSILQPTACAEGYSKAGATAGLAAY